MKPDRLNALTDGVVAIAITIIVLELPLPPEPTFAGLRAVSPMLLAYLLSFINIGIFWNNHHHMLTTATRVDGRVLLAERLARRPPLDHHQHQLAHAGTDRINREQRRACRVALRGLGLHQQQLRALELRPLLRCHDRSHNPGQNHDRVVVSATVY